MSKKKKFPKDMDELEKSFYGPNKDGKNPDLYKISQYSNNTVRDILSPHEEKFVQKVFSPWGKVEKIKETSSTTSDFKIDSKKYVIEVTSVNYVDSPTQNISSNFVQTKLNEAINHIHIKKDLSVNDFHKGGFIFVDNVFDFKFNVLQELNKNLQLTIPKELDFIIFSPCVTMVLPNQPNDNVVIYSRKNINDFNTLPFLSNATIITI